MKTFQKPLTAGEEEYYLMQLRGNDKEAAKEAKNILVEHNLRLVAHIAKKYQNVDEEMEDLISIGCIGLIKAIDSFDIQKGRLATYACRCIDNAMLTKRIIIDAGRRIRVLRPAFFDKSIRNCINKFHFLFSGTLQIFHVLRYILSVNFDNTKVKLSICFRCFGVMYDNVYSKPSFLSIILVYAHRLVQYFINVNQSIFLLYNECKRGILVDITNLLW